MINPLSLDRLGFVPLEQGGQTLSVAKGQGVLIELIR